MFSSDEINNIESAVETYNDSPRGLFVPEVQQKLAKSTLSKLSNYSPMTYFTKQEYTFMAVAIKYLMDSFETMGLEYPDDLFSLFTKILDLAEPATT